MLSWEHRMIQTKTPHRIFVVGFPNVTCIEHAIISGTGPPSYCSLTPKREYTRGLNRIKYNLHGLRVIGFK